MHDLTGTIVDFSSQEELQSKNHLPTNLTIEYFEFQSANPKDLKLVYRGKRIFQ